MEKLNNLKPLFSRNEALYISKEVKEKMLIASKGKSYRPGVWVSYGGVKTLENHSRKFHLLIFSRLPQYIYMDDILSRFKCKERESSSSDSETSPQGKRVCSQEPNEMDEILIALDISKDIGAKLQ